MNELLVNNRVAASTCGRALRSWTRDLAAGRIGPEPVRFSGSNSLMWRPADLEMWTSNPKPGGELRTRKEWKLFIKNEGVSCKTQAGLTSAAGSPKIAAL